MGEAYQYKEENKQTRVETKKNKHKMIPDNLSIIKSEYIEHYIIRLSFSDGTVNDVDFGNYLFKHPHPQYDKYRDLSKFKKYSIDKHGDIYWGKHGDLMFPVESLYFNNLEKNYELDYTE